MSNLSDLATELEKRVHPDSNRNPSRLQRTVWWFGILIPFLFFAFGAGFRLMKYFTDPSNDSIVISNYGFAILIGLTSSCFGYYKILESQKYVRLHKDIQKCGELFFSSSIAFIMSSAMKYAWGVEEVEHTTHIVWHFLLRWAYIASFTLAELLCIYGLSLLIDVLHIRRTISKAKSGL